MTIKGILKLHGFDTEKIDYLPVGRFKLLDKPLLQPGLDIIDRTPDGPVFDLGVDTDDLMPGVAYLRAQDVRDMAHCLGMITADEAASLYAQIQILKEKVENVPQVVRTFKDGIDSLIVDFHYNLTRASDLPLVPVAESPAEPNEPVSDSESDVGNTDETGISEGPNELPDDSGNAFGFLDEFDGDAEQEQRSS